MSAEGKKERDDVAIVGMACIFPGAEGPEQFWWNTLRKKVQIGHPRPEWRSERYVGAIGPTHISSPAGGYLRELYRFDPAELGVMPNSIDGGEPDQFLALKVARDALADARCLTNYDHTNSGIVLGHSTYLHRGSANTVQHGVVVQQTVELVAQLFPEAPPAALEKLRNSLVAKLPPFNADVAPALVPNVMTGRIANRFDLRGPNYLIDAACASSLLAVNAAMEELRSGRSDLMLAGGINASIPSVATMVFTHLGALSPRSIVSPFDAAADGTLLGEGAGIIVLKRLKDARRAGDRIYAVLKGIGQSSDGKGAGLLAPRMDGEVLAIRRAYENAEVDPKSVALIEAHGTGIPLGDRTEINALRETFGVREGDLPRIGIGSIKSMIGHCIPAAGIAGVIKTALALHYRVIPPTVCANVNEALNIEQTKLYVSTQPRPWVASRKCLRRAGINAFGFGGVNSHAVMEEASETETAKRPAYLPAELIVLSGSDQQQLVATIEKLEHGLEHSLAHEPLAALAAAMAAKETTGPIRLAIVAEDLGDLRDKLRRARSRILEQGPRIMLRAGIYCSDQPFSGKVAFVFPGEGCQYESMLSELIITFPEARRWFDFWEGLYTPAEDRPSDCVYPPPTGVSAAVRERLRKKLFGLEMGSESALIACHALLAVTRSLGLHADVMVGHSSGEHAALFAAGALSWKDWDDLETRLRQIKQLYYAMEHSAEVPGGALLTVGAIPRHRVIELAEEAQVHIALDNCEQQIVLYGEQSKLERVSSQLGQEGGLCTFLPFSRPYHTPLFSPNADLNAVYEKFDFQTPVTPLYSCASARLMPDAPQEIRKLVVSQWRSRVRFSETVDQMYADGVRAFIEVGASAKLTGFIGNILNGKDSLCVALDSARRPGLLQFLHSLARLWSAGIAFDVSKLFHDRSLVPSQLSNEKTARKRDRVFDNTLPFIELSSETAAELREALWQNYTARSARQPQTAEVSSLYPFLDRLVSQDATKLVAECDLHVDRHAFLRHHCLYASHVSDLDPKLTGLVVVPLAVSMEMLAEIAAASTGGLVPIRLERLRAHNWIALDDGARTVVLEATRLSEGDGHVRVNTRLVDEQGSTLLESVVVLAEVVRATSAADIFPAALQNPQACIGLDDELYRTGMFLGPLFQSVGSLVAWDGTGLDALLGETSLEGFFEPAKRPSFLFNPVLLDAAGHVTAFWLAQRLGTNFSSFPSSIETIDLYDAARENTRGSYIAYRVASDEIPNHGSFVVGEFACFDTEGAPLFRATGWRDRFFDVPARFFYARFQPRDGFYGDDVTALFGSLPEGSIVWRVTTFGREFLDDAGGIWRRVLAATILSAEERKEWKSLVAPQLRRDEWLLGRIAIKEVARVWIERTYGVRLYPADVIVRVAPSGKPYISGEGLEQLGEMPEISVAHVSGEAVAIAAQPLTPVGIDVEAADRVRTSDLLAGAFSGPEQTLIKHSDSATPLRVLLAWCAKEAAAKWLGTGMNGRPQSFVLTSLDEYEALSCVVVPGNIAVRVSFAVDDQRVLAVAYAA